MDPTQRDEIRDRKLTAGEIVTVIADDEAHAETSRNQAFVVIDGFDHPNYAIAALGGDGYEWRNQPREWLQAQPAPRLRQDRDAAGNVTYLVD
jgi:hypothetical protein